MRDNQGKLIAKNINQSFKEIFDDQKEQLRNKWNDLFREQFGWRPASTGRGGKHKVKMNFPPFFPTYGYVNPVTRGYSFICKNKEAKDDVERLHKLWPVIEKNEGRASKALEVHAARTISFGQSIGVSPQQVLLEVQRQVHAILGK